MKSFFFKFALTAALLIASGIGTSAQTIINASSCAESAVQSALNSVAVDNTIVVLPSCTSGVSWSYQLAYTARHSMTIQGQTTCTGTPASSCTDGTVIKDGMTSDTPLLYINTTAGKFFRMTGITFQNTAIQQFNGALQINGTWPTSLSPNIRLDHLHLNNINEIGILFYNALGVWDHSYIQMGGANWNAFKVRNTAASGVGDEAWNRATNLGTSEFMFIEDNTFTSGVVNDCQHGGRFVIRHNKLLNGAGTQSHGTGSGGSDVRGCRAFEVYQNAMTGLSGCSGACFTAHYYNSGTGVIWGNSADANFQHVMIIHSIRRSNSEYGEIPTPSGWGYCGKSLDGTGSAWDQNLNTTTGYACIDQLGRGQGDLITGAMPHAVNSNKSNVITWTRESLEPLYMWMNIWTGTPASYYTVAFDGVAGNQDYYDWCDPKSTNGCTRFNGTEGVGSGTLANRPSLCSPNPISYSGPYVGVLGISPGVGYWATDQNKLYICTATNTWTAYYTPYQSPHPLQGK